MKNLLTCIARTMLLVLLVVPLSARAQSNTEAPDAIASRTNLHNTLWNARVDSIDTDRGSLILADCPSIRKPGQTSTDCLDKTISVSVVGDAKQQLKLVHVGDHAQIGLIDDKTISSISPRAQTVGLGARMLALTSSYLATFILATLFTRGHPLQLIIGQDNRYSNSKFQMALWFSILIATYITTIFFRLHLAGWDFWGGINIPPHLLALSGASALTYGAAKGITTSKVQAAVAAGGANPKTPGTPHFLLDLISDDGGGFDLGDFQMLIVTLLAVAMYLVTIFHFLGIIESLKAVSLPDVDTTILTAFGLGQGAYLVKKAAGNPGAS